MERLWPRGVRKADLRLDGWLKEVAPSPELRRWFGHDPEKWPEFKRRYLEELRGREAAMAPLRAAALVGRVTLVYAAKDTTHNSASVLRDYLAGRRRPPSGARSDRGSGGLAKRETDREQRPPAASRAGP